MTTILPQDQSWNIQTRSTDETQFPNRPQNGKAGTNALASGDTVTISDEAKELLATKMEEYGVENPQEMSKAQRQDLHDTLIEETDLTEEDLQTMAQQSGLAAGAQGTAPAGGKPSTGSAGAQAAGSAGGAQAGGTQGASSTSSDTTVEDLEQDIEDLENEINALRSKAGSDDKAKEKLETKQAELNTLKAELNMEETG